MIGVATMVAYRTGADLQDLRQVARIASWQASQTFDPSQETWQAYERCATVRACMREAWAQRSVASGGRHKPKENCAHTRVSFKEEEPLDGDCPSTRSDGNNLVLDWGSCIELGQTSTPEDLLDLAKFDQAVRERILELGRETAALQVMLEHKSIEDVARERRMEYFEVHSAVRRLRERIRNDRKCRNLLDSRKL